MSASARSGRPCNDWRVQDGKSADPVISERALRATAAQALRAIPAQALRVIAAQALRATAVQALRVTAAQALRAIAAQPLRATAAQAGIQFSDPRDRSNRTPLRNPESNNPLNPLTSS